MKATSVLMTYEPKFSRQKIQVRTLDLFVLDFLIFCTRSIVRNGIVVPRELNETFLGNFDNNILFLSHL